MNSKSNDPTRLHYNTYATSDMEAARHLYEDVLGMPLVATWCEEDMVFGKERAYRHCFFGLNDDSAHAFFPFADPQDQSLFGPQLPTSPFRHIALTCVADFQHGAYGRLVTASSKEPDICFLEHGYRKSLYAPDSNGMILESAVDNPAASEGAAERQANARAELKRWLAGNHTSNNTRR